MRERVMVSRMSRAWREARRRWLSEMVRSGVVGVEGLEALDHCADLEALDRCADLEALDVLDGWVGLRYGWACWRRKVRSVGERRLRLMPCSVRSWSMMVSL